jgi:hypothetical protein
VLATTANQFIDAPSKIGVRLVLLGCRAENTMKPLRLLKNLSHQAKSRLQMEEQKPVPEQNSPSKILPPRQEGTKGGESVGGTPQSKIGFPINLLIRPWFYLAVGLHAALLMLPTQWEFKKSQLPKEEDVVKITRIRGSDAKDASQSSAPPFPSSTPTPQPPPRSSQRQEVPARLTAARSPELRLNAESQERERSETSSEPENDRPSSGTSPKKQTTSEPTNPPDDFFENFPKYPNVRKGSGGVLRPEFENGYVFNTGDSLETVVAKFERELLPPSPFRWENRTNESNFRVYQVFRSSDDESKFLHLIFEENKTVLYLESQLYSLEDLKNAKTEPMNDLKTAEILLVFLKSGNLLDKNEDAINQIVHPELFDRSGFTFYVPQTQPIDFSSVDNFIAALEKNLKKEDTTYEMRKVSDYQEGMLYKLTQENSHIYLIFVPTKEQKTVIVMSPNDPR